MMTDTTDIAALRDVKRWGIVATGDHYFKFVTKNISDGPYVKQEDYFALLALLEAERQRAADLVLHVNTQANMREKAEKERDGVVKNYNRVTDERNSALYEVAELKAKLANPVVLPELCSVFEGEYADSPQIVPDQDGYVFYSHRVIESIIIAGFTVKE